MMLLALVGTAWALRCNGMAFDPDDVGVLPRNVRWVPRHFRWEVDVTLHPDPTRGRVFHTGGGPYDMLELRLRRLLPANTAFEVRMDGRIGIADFQTNDVVDRRPPEGGALVGGFRGDIGDLVLVFTPVSDESRVVPIVESWAESSPEARTLGVGWLVHHAPVAALPPWEKMIFGPGRLAELVGPGWGEGYTLVVDDRNPRCGGPARHLDLASFRISRDGNEARYVRTRWMDVAGNVTAWSEPLRLEGEGRGPWRAASE